MRKEWQAALAVIQKIQEAGFEAVFVGGAVRDRLLGKTANDIDIATSALPDEVKRIFHKTVDVGIEHGTILVLDAGVPIEVTTYRTEGDYADFRRPEVVQFVRNLEDDLKRRDFTINALAERNTGEIVDLFGGQADLHARVIRAVGSAEERFSEDALRMLRAARFSAQLGFTIENNTFLAIKQHAPLIEHIAIERIAIELEKMWLSEMPITGMRVLIDSGLSDYLPGDFQAIYHKWISFHATDVKDGWAYFILTTKDESLIKHYKLSNKEKNYYIQIRDALTLLQKSEVSSIELFETDIFAIQKAAYFAKLLHVNTCDVKKLIERKNSFVLQDRRELMVSGNDLLEWKGSRGGPWVKEALSRMLQAVLEGQVENDQQQLKDWFIRYDNN